MKIYLPIIVLFFSVCAQAQTAKPVAKTTTQPPAKTTTTTTTTTTAPPATSKTPVVDEGVHVSQTKLVTFHDPEYKKTNDYAKRQKKYSKTMDDTARKDIAYPDGSKIKLKMVRNPSFGGMPTSIKSTTAKGSEKKETKKTDAGQWDCASSSISLTASSTNFLNADYSASAGYIYPGAVYTFDNFFGGNYIEQTGTRYPITLVNENPNISGSAYTVVKDPGMGKTTNGVDRLREEMKGTAGTEDFKYQVYETGNSAAQGLQVSGGGSYAGFSAQNTFSTSSSMNSVSLTIDATKILYTINLAPQDSGFYADPKIENTRNLMVIGRVSYGIRVLANLTYTFNSTQEADQFKANYSGFGGSANVSLNQMSQSSSVSNTINAYVVGGPGKTTMSFDKKSLEKEIQAIFAGANYKNAVPIAYTFFDMAGDLVGSYSATDNFTDRNCVPNTSGARLKSIFVTFNTGQDGKDNDTHYTISLYGGNAGTKNNYNGYDNNPPQTVDSHEPFIAQYKTGPLNVVFSPQQSSTVPLTMNAFMAEFAGTSGVYHDLNMDYFAKHGGIVHLHIYPNGSDSWNLQNVVLQLNFDGAPSQNITFNSFTVSDKSTEMTLYFDGTFKAK
jgi:hypothetical protein